MPKKVAQWRLTGGSYAESGAAAGLAAGRLSSRLRHQKLPRPRNELVFATVTACALQGRGRAQSATSQQAAGGRPVASGRPLDAHWTFPYLWKY